MCKAMGRELSPAEHAAAMRAIDSDGGGNISYEEFVAWWAQDGCEMLDALAAAAVEP